MCNFLPFQYGWQAQGIRRSMCDLPGRRKGSAGRFGWQAQGIRKSMCDLSGKRKGSTGRCASWLASAMDPQVDMRLRRSEGYTNPVRRRVHWPPAKRMVHWPPAKRRVHWPPTLASSPSKGARDQEAREQESKIAGEQESKIAGEQERNRAREQDSTKAWDHTSHIFFAEIRSGGMRGAVKSGHRALGARVWPSRSVLV